MCGELWRELTSAKASWNSALCILVKQSRSKLLHERTRQRQDRQRSKAKHCYSHPGALQAEARIKNNLEAAGNSWQTTARTHPSALRTEARNEELRCQQPRSSCGWQNIARTRPGVNREETKMKIAKVVGVWQTVAHTDGSVKASSDRSSGEQMTKQILLARTQLYGRQLRVRTAPPSSRPVVLEVVESRRQNKILLTRTQMCCEQWCVLKTGQGQHTVHAGQQNRSKLLHPVPMNEPGTRSWSDGNAKAGRVRSSGEQQAKQILPRTHAVVR